MSERKLTRDLTSEFPSNSNKVRETVAKKEGDNKRKKLEPIVKGKIVVEKKSFGKRFLESFLGDDSTSVGDYLINDILVPAMKGTISDLVGGGLDMFLFGERRGRNSSYYKGDRNKSYTSYGSYYGRGRDDSRRDSRRELSRDSRARHDFTTIELDHRDDAEDVLSILVDQIVDFGVVSVADYYELVGIESNHTDENYGWTNLSSATTVRLRDGYAIKLPKPKPI